MTAQPTLATPTPPAQHALIQAWRSHVLTILLRSIFGLSTVILAVVVIVNLSDPEARGLLPIYFVCYALIGVIAFVKQIPYIWRASGLLGLLYAMAAIGLYESGLSGDGRIFMLTFVAMTAIFFGRNIGLGALLLAALTLAFMAWMFVSGVWSVPIEGQANTGRASSWLTGSIVFIMLTVILVTSMTYLLQHLGETLNDNMSMLGDLVQARRDLEEQVDQRTAVLTRTLEHAEQQAAEKTKLAYELAQQREVIYGLSIPIIPVTDKVLVMPLIGALDSERLQQAQEQALRRIEGSKMQYLIIDITGVPVIDSQVAQGLVAVVNACRLLGARVTIVGVRPEVAQTIVNLGLSLDVLESKADLHSALSGINRAIAK